MNENNSNEKIKKSDNHNSNNNNNSISTNNDNNKSINYTRRDFLKLLGAGTVFLTLGGLLNPISALASRNNTQLTISAVTVDNIQLLTEQRNTVRASASANSPASLYYGVTRKPASGQLNWAGRGFAYTPNIGFIGTDSFTYIAVDGDGGVSNTGTVNINVRNIIPVPPYKYKVVSRPNQKTYYTAHDTRTYLSDDTGEKRFQAVIESYDTSFINQEVTAVLTMNGVSATDRIELVTRTGYPTNQYPDQRSGYVFYLTNSGNQTKRFMILNKNVYEDRSSLVTPKFSLGGSLANRTFGMKAVTYVIPGTNNVKLEFYLDLNNIGDFKLYYELVDSGQIPNAHFVNPPGATAKIRCDDITNSPSLEYFEVAEIDPLSPTNTIRS
ncbi:MAG: Ig-like domain-containing protein [Nitrososphaeraceae archaeon]